MSRASYLICDGCGATLHIPANPAVAEHWEIISRTFHDGDKQRYMDLHWCGECSNRERIIKRVEMAR